MNRDFDYYNNYNNQNNIYQNEINSLRRQLEREKSLKNEIKEKYNSLKSDYKELEEKYWKLKESKNIKKHESEILELKSEKEELEKKFYSINEECKQLKLKLNAITEEKNKLEKCIKKENETHNKQMNKLDNDLNIKNEKINQLQKDIDDTVKKNKELKKEMEQKSLRFDGAINQFQDMRNQLRYKDIAIKDLQSQFKDFNDIKKKYENILKNNDKEKPREEDLKTPQEEYYDAIVEINSIKSLRKKGWTLYYNKERKERYQQMISEETLKIGVIGLNNVGKTFILSKLSNAKLNPGYSLETKGISIKYSEINKGEIKGLCILDSAGFETPLLKEEFEEIKNNKEENSEFMQNLEYGIEDDLSRDKAQIEKFIEQLIISLSDMIILVVGKMTRTEQRLITKIKTLIKKKKKIK